MAADEPSDEHVFAWEGIYERPWDAVVTASDGTLHGAGAQANKKRTRSEVTTGVRRAVMRSVVLVIDASRAAGARCGVSHVTSRASRVVPWSRVPSTRRCFRLGNFCGADK